MSRHAAYYEGSRYEMDELSITQRHMHKSAAEIHTVRTARDTTPGGKKTSPTLQSAFRPADLNSYVFDSLVAPLPHVLDNPQDAVHRGEHPAASNGGGNRRSLPTAEKRVIGAGGTRARQVFQKQSELKAISHPMAGGKIPPRIDLRQTYDMGDRPYFAMSVGQAAPSDPRVQPKDHKKYRDAQLRAVLSVKPTTNHLSAIHPFKRG